MSHLVTNTTFRHRFVIETNGLWPQLRIYRWLDLAGLQVPISCHCWLLHFLQHCLPHSVRSHSNNRLGPVGARSGCQSIIQEWKWNHLKVLWIYRLSWSTSNGRWFSEEEFYEHNNNTSYYWVKMNLPKVTVGVIMEVVTIYINKSTPLVADVSQLISCPLSIHQDWQGMDYILQWWSIDWTVIDFTMRQETDNESQEGEAVVTCVWCGGGGILWTCGQSVVNRGHVRSLGCNKKGLMGRRETYRKS